jgi:hypothetical protein
MNAARPANGTKTKTGRGRPQSRWLGWRPRVAWGTAILGGLMFIAGNIGARAGITILPFDPHHVYAQFGGGALAIDRLMWATGNRR